MNKINYYARHEQLSVAAGFETEEQRDQYIKLSISNRHPWIACTMEEAHICECYHNHYLD